MASARVKEERCTDSPEPTVKCEVDSPPVEEWWCAVSPAPEPTDFDFGSLETRNRTTHEQFLTLLDFMERHGDLGRPQHGAQAKLRGEQKWQELAATLNSVAGGIEKTMDKWKKVWADWKTKTKKKHTLIRRYARGAGGRPHGRQALNALEKRVVAVMRNTAALRSQREDEAFSAQAQARDPLYQGNQVNQVNQVHQHMFEMPCNNILILSQPNAPPTPQTYLLPPSRPSLPSLTPAPAAAAPPAPQPATPAPPLPPTMSTPTTQPTKEKTPKRKLLLTRRQSQYVTVEKLRLQFENTREKLMHQREMERLRLEAERIAVAREHNQLLGQLAVVAGKILDVLSGRRPANGLQPTEPLPDSE